MDIKTMIRNSVRLADVPSDACPFSWREIHLGRGCIGNLLSMIPIIGNAFREETVYTPVPCIGDRCKLWNSSKNDCVFNEIRIG